MEYLDAVRSNGFAAAISLVAIVVWAMAVFYRSLDDDDNGLFAPWADYFALVLYVYLLSLSSGVLFKVTEPPVIAVLYHLAIASAVYGVGYSPYIACITPETKAKILGHDKLVYLLVLVAFVVAMVAIVMLKALV